jgi:hypothetical protein
MVFRLTGVARFFAYGDPSAGEYGAVYQAAGWLYLGQGLNGRGGRRMRYFVLPPGNEDKPENWRTTRDLRRKKRMTFAEAKAAGWRIAQRGGKYVYAMNVGRDRKQWRKQILTNQKERFGLPLPFPAPQPELKRTYRLTPIESAQPSLSL